MKLETFFAKFELFADAPNAVAKMRGLVLHLAFSGKLLPASEPWPLEPLKSLATKIGSGATPAGGRESYFGEGIPFIRSMNIHFAGFESKGLVFLNDEQATQLASVTVKPADVLLNITGASIGRVTTAPPEMAGARVNQHVAIIRPTKELDAPFLAKYLASPAIQRMIDDVQVGATREALTKGMIEKFQIPLPPLAEQKRIVAKVDELMALCDRLEAQQQERETRHAALARASLARFADAPTPANLELLFHKSYSIPPADLRKSILTLAVQGKLVPQDPSDEPADSSLPRLARVAVEVQDDLFPRHWLRVPLGDFGEWRGGGTPSKSQPDFWKGDMPWVSPKDMKTLRISDARDHISQGAIEGSSVRLIPAGSILMVVRGMILARAFPVALTEREVTINQDMKALIPSESGAAEFLLLALRAFEPDVLAAIERSSHGTCKLKTEVLEAFQIPVPPLAEQCRIVAKVDELMALVDHLEKQQAAANARSGALLEAIIRDLLNPTAKIIPFPISERDSLPDRAAIGCYAIQRLSDQRTFGRTAQVKVLYMAEAHLGLALGGRYMRDAAGPLDKWIYTFEEEAAREQWFSVVEGATKEGHKKIEYRKGPNLSTKAQEASSRLSAAQRSELDCMLALLAQKPTVEVEIIATLFAAWNDFLIDGRQPDDDEIVREVRENWHPSKQRFSQAELRSWLAWLRQHELVPQGKGPHTQGRQRQLQLH